MQDNPERALAEYIRAERVRFVFIQSLLPIIFSPLAAAILSLALWKVVDHRVLLVWTGGLMALAIVRGLLISAFSRIAPDEQNVRRWERIFVTSIMAVEAHRRPSASRTRTPAPGPRPNVTVAGCAE